MKKGILFLILLIAFTWVFLPISTRAENNPEKYKTGLLPMTPEQMEEVKTTWRKIEKVKLGGRGSYYCPECQK